MTEAACLLRTGALYPLRLGLRPASGDDIFLGVKPGAFSIYRGDAPIYHFDLEGRWQRAFIEGIHYLKSLDSSVHAIERVREGENLVLRRRPLSFAQAIDLDDQIRAMALDLIEHLGSSYLMMAAPEGTETLTHDQASSLLELIARWDPATWFAHHERYVETYGPLPFLPPDSSSPIILQSTLGDTSGIGFAGGAKHEFHERSPDEFREHCRKVMRLLGRRILQCRQVFLGGSDALRRPIASVRADLKIACEILPIVDQRPRLRAKDVDVLSEIPSVEGIHAFLHEFESPVMSEEESTELKRRHLKRVILGIESGSEQVRSQYGRVWTENDLYRWLASCRMDVGVVVVVGAGGVEGAEDHIKKTIALFENLRLPAKSLVSLVDADDLDSRPASDRGFEPLDRSHLAQQRTDLKARLATILAPSQVKVTTYSTDKRWQ